MITLHAAVLAAVLAAPAAPAEPAKAPPAKAAAPQAKAEPLPALGEPREDKGVRFMLPTGWAYSERIEDEPGEPGDLVYSAVKGALEVKAEIEAGPLECADEARRLPGPGGAEACELEMAGPPSLDPKMPPRRAASYSLRVDAQHHIHVLAFAPDGKRALALARAVAATAAVVR